MGYKHLTREQRYTIEALLQTPMSLREIGEVIGVSTGTVSREIRRNCDMRGYHRYRWRLAQKKYERRMKDRRHYLKFTICTPQGDCEGTRCRVLLCLSVSLLGTWRKRKHEWTDTPIHPERYGLQRADRRDAC